MTKAQLCSCCGHTPRHPERSEGPPVTSEVDPSFVGMTWVVTCWVWFFVSTAPLYATVLPAEVVARQLHVSGLGWAGHIGITTGTSIDAPSNFVIEILKEPIVIQTNSISDFKARSKYWGARYGINKTSISAIKMLNQAALQESFRCAEYTYGFDYKPGVGEYGKPVVCPVFRCDTFVNYIFHTGGYDLATYNAPGKVLHLTLPRLVYNAFPYQHDATFWPRVETPLAEFDNLPKNKLYVLLNDSSISQKKRWLILDKLGFIADVTDIEKLIAIYHRYNDVETRHLVVRDLQIIYQHHTAAKLPTLNKFFLQELAGDLNPQTIAPIIRGFITLNSPTTILQQQAQLDKTLQNQALMPSLRTALLLNLAFKTPALAAIYLPRLLLNAQQYSIQDLTFITANIRSELLRKNSVIQHKNSLNNFLNYFAQRLRDQDEFIMPQSNGIWLETTALVNAPDPANIGPIIAAYFKKLTPDEQSNYLIGFSNSAFLQTAFTNEQVLQECKQRNAELYQITVGS